MFLGVVAGVAGCVFCSTKAGFQGLISKEKMSAHMGGEGVLPRASVIMPLRFLLSARGTAGRSSRKISGYNQKLEGIAGGVGNSRVFN